MKRKLPAILIGLIVASGLLILAYPTLSNWYNQKYHIQSIVTYQESVGNMAAEVKQAEWNLAVAYNDALTGADIEDPFIPGSGAVLPDNYTSVLDISNGLMGYIDIPVVDIYLPIYHGTSDTVLANGAGHMEMTAFPIGGAGNHCVLTGHTALPGALLFTNLQDMVLGDMFYINVLDEVLAYEVDQVLVIEPTDTSALKPVKGEDYITLITCTPYAINSHRLLVRGVRIPYDPGHGENEIDLPQTATREKLPYYVIALIVVSTLLGFVLLISLLRRRKGRHKRGRRQ